MQKTSSSILFAAALLALAGAGEAAAHEAPLPAAVAAASPASQAEPLAARFELRLNKLSTDWYLWRQADVVETANVLAGQGSIWQRLGADGYRHQRIFHGDRRVVEYLPNELKTRHAEPDWEKLGSLISPQLLGELRQIGRKTLFGQPAVRYVGRAGGQQIDLWWLEKARLPARLQMVSAGHRMSMSLKDLHAGAPASWPTAWPRADEHKLADYGLLDAADFGDMENDPFVAKIMQADGHGHTH